MNKFKSFSLLILLFFAYVIGVLTVRNNWKIYRIASVYKSKIIDNFNTFENSIEGYFINPIIDSEDLIYRTTTSRKELRNNVNRFLNHPKISNIYDNVVFNKVTYKGNTLKLNYSIDGKIDSLYSYFKINEEFNNASLIIPGSGINQSSAIYYKKSVFDNYQCNIDDMLSRFGSVFVYIKPNEDILAIHNGTLKIDENSYVNYLLNNGYSFSEYYIGQTIVLGKYLKSKYSTTTVAGLSQGGLATLINTIYLEPDFSIVSSGYSILMDTPYASNHRQIIIPSYRKTFNSDSIIKYIKELKTKFLFTYGKKEAGIYGDESLNQLTKLFFSELNNVEVQIHNDGHIFPRKEILDFMERNQSNIKN